jgi:putative hemolysin
MDKTPDPLSYAHPEDPLLKRILISALERATGRNRVASVYREVKALEAPGLNVWGESLRRLRISGSYAVEKLRSLPRDRPLLFIANHPFGVVDGLLLGQLMREVRPDFRILVNEVLCRDSLFDDYFLPIDFREIKAAMRTNLRTRQIAMSELAGGGMVGIFPSGGVATAHRPWGRAEDLEWKRFTAGLLQRSEATVVPLFFYGQNSPLFHLASRIDPNLRLGLLLHEVRNKMGWSLRIGIGDPIPPDEWRGFGDRQAILDRLRERVFQLEEIGSPTKIPFRHI